MSSGMAMPTTANTMWKASDTPICERAARRSDIVPTNYRRRARRAVPRPPEFMPPAPHPTLRFFAFSARLRIEKPVRGDLRRIAATLNNPLKSRPVTALLRRDGLSLCGDMPGKGERGQVPTLRELLADGKVHVLDGAMGTMLYAKGFFLNVCYDELSVKQPQLVREVHEAYVRAGAESGGRASVVGAIGPLGVRLEPFGSLSREEAFAHFQRQVRGLLAGGVDGFILETFSDVDELHEALRAVRSLSDLPVIAQMTIGTDGLTHYG